jgi:outer membrane protein TolC
MLEVRLLCGCLLAGATILHPAWAEDAFTPSRATLRQPATTSLNGRLIDLSLSDAVFLGLRGNRTIQSAYLDRIAQKYDLRVAEDYFNPKLVLGGRYVASKGSVDGTREGVIAPVARMVSPIGTQFSLSWNSQINRSDRYGNQRRNGVTFTVLQPLLRGAGHDVATAPVRLARLMEQSNRLGLQATVSRTVTRIILAYRDLLRTQEQLTIASDSLARSRQLLDINKALIAAGRMAQFEIIQTEADTANQELGVEEARNQVEASRLALLQLLALDLSNPVKASDTPKAEPLQINELEAQRLALEHQPDYLSQVIAGEQAEINLTVARNNSLWDVSLVGGANQARDQFSGGYEGRANRNWQSYAGIQIEVPIGNPATRQGEVQAKVNVDTQAVRIKEAQQQLEREVANAIRDVRSRWRQYEIAGRARDLSRKKLEFEREKLQAGRSSNFQVLSFETDLRNAENARLNALIGYLNAQTELDQRLGMTLKSWDIALND